MRSEHPLIVALVEAFARRADIPVDGLWSYVDRKAAPPPAVRDAIVAAFFPRVPPESFLPYLATDATLATEMQNESTGTRQQRVSRARLLKGNRKHPFVAALVAKGLTVTEFARELGYPRATVQSWYDGNNLRPIPRRAADEIRRRFGVPVSTWTKIVD